MFSSDSLPFRISSKLYCIRFLRSRMSYSRQTGRESAIRVRICFIIFRQFPRTFATVTSQHLSVMSLAARIRNPICFEKIGTPAKWGLDLMNTSQLKNSPPEPTTVAASILDLTVYSQNNETALQFNTWLRVCKFKHLSSETTIFLWLCAERLRTGGILLECLARIKYTGFQRYTVTIIRVSLKVVFLMVGYEICW